MAFKLETITFKALSQEDIYFYLPVVKKHFSISGKKIFGMQLDLELLNQDLKEICICGDYPPEYVYYLNSLVFRILKICKKNP